MAVSCKEFLEIFDSFWGRKNLDNRLILSNLAWTGIRNKIKYLLQTALEFPTLIFCQISLSKKQAQIPDFYKYYSHFKKFVNNPYLVSKKSNLNCTILERLPNGKRRNIKIIIYFQKDTQMQSPLINWSMINLKNVFRNTFFSRKGT
jgi:hypothetical protein